MHKTQIPPSGSASTAAMLFNASGDHALLSALSCPAACCRTSWPGREPAMPHLADPPSVIQLFLRLHSSPSTVQVAQASGSIKSWSTVRSTSAPSCLAGRLATQLDQKRNSGVVCSGTQPPCESPRARLSGRGGSPQNPPYSTADPRRVTTRSSSADCSSRFVALTTGSFGPLPTPAVLIGFTAAAAELAATELAATTELTLGDCHPNHFNGVISCRATHRNAVE